MTTGVPAGTADATPSQAAAHARPQDRALVWAAVEASTASATWRAYAADWARFARWCDQFGIDAATADEQDVAAYIAGAAAEVRPDGSPAVATATLRRWVSGLTQMHAAAGRDPAPGRSELVRRTLAGIGKSRRRPPNRRRPLLLAELASLVTTARESARTWPQQVRARRNRLAPRAVSARWWASSGRT